MGYCAWKRKKSAKGTGFSGAAKYMNVFNTINIILYAHYQKFFIVYCLGELMTGAGMAGVTYYASNKDDPYITLENPVSKVKPIELCTAISAEALSLG